MIISTSDLFHQTIDLYQKNFRVIFKYSLLTILPTVLGFTLLVPLFFVSDVLFKRESLIVGYGSIIVSIIVLLAMFLLSVIITTTLFRIIARLYHTEKLEKARVEMKHSVDVFGTVILTSVVITLLVAFGTLALIVPGIVAGTYFSFAFYLAMIDGLPMSESMRMSIQMVRGRFWQVLWLFFISTAIVFALLLVGNTAVTFPMSLLSERFTSPTIIISIGLLFMAFKYLVGIALTPLAYIAQIIIFEKAKNITTTSAQKIESSV
jgi:hypothetical protein